MHKSPEKWGRLVKYVCRLTPLNKDNSPLPTSLSRICWAAILYPHRQLSCDDRERAEFPGENRPCRSRHAQHFVSSSTDVSLSAHNPTFPDRKVNSEKDGRMVQPVFTGEPMIRVLSVSRCKVLIQ